MTMATEDGLALAGRHLCARARQCFNSFELAVERLISPDRMRRFVGVIPVTTIAPRFRKL